MKVVVTVNEKTRKITDEILLYSVCNNKFLLKLFIGGITKKLKKAGDIFYATEELKKYPQIYEILNKKLGFYIFTNSVYLEYLDVIIKKMQLSSYLKICIFSRENDDKLLKVIYKIKGYVKVIYLVTDDEALFEKTREEIFEKYGIGVILKKHIEIKNYDIGIILNYNISDYNNTARYIINLSDCEIEGKCILYDIIPYGYNKIQGLHMKKSCLLEKSSENFNLCWKKS